MAEAPYREIAHEQEQAKPPAELVYRPKLVGRLSVGVLPLLLCIALGTVVGNAYGLAWLGLVVGGGIGFLVAQRIRKKSGPVVFRVREGRLVVDRGGPGSVMIDAPLEDLHDVAMTTHNYEPRDNITGRIVGFGIQRPKQSSADESRLELHLRGRAEPIFLTEENTQHLEAEEWFGKIRAFLRKSDWLPLDERAAASSE